MEVSMNWAELEQLKNILNGYERDKAMDELRERLYKIEELHQESLRYHLEGKKKIKG
jgi:hypothetical protein